MSNETTATDLGEIVYVLRLARDGWPEDRSDWATDAFSFAAWNGFFTSGDKVALTDEGRAFLAKAGRLYPEAR